MKGTIRERVRGKQVRVKIRRRLTFVVSSLLMAGLFTVAPSLTESASAQTPTFAFSGLAPGCVARLRDGAAASIVAPGTTVQGVDVSGWAKVTGPTGLDYAGYGAGLLIDETASCLLSRTLGAGPKWISEPASWPSAGNPVSFGSKYLYYSVNRGSISWRDGPNIQEEAGCSSTLCSGTGMWGQFRRVANGWSVQHKSQTESLESLMPDHIGANGTFGLFPGGGTLYLSPEGWTTPGFTLAAALVGSSDRTAVTKQIRVSLADPVDAATGSFVHELSDIASPSKGVPFAFMRSYDSRSVYDGPLGKGWGHGFDERLAVAPNGNVTWASGGGGSLVFTPNGAGGYVAPTGVIATLRAASPSGWELVRSDQVISAFDANGRVLSRRDRSGQGLVFAYDAQARLSTVTDPAGRVHTLTYGAAAAGAAAGRLVQVKTSDNRTLKFAYTALAAGVRLTGFTNERAKVTTYEYDASGFLTKQVDPQGNSEFVNVYDTTGRVTSQQDALANVSTFVWNDSAGTVTFTDAAGAVQTHQSSNFAVGASTGPEGTSSIAYDADMNPSSFTDQTGAVWAATYDGRGNMLTRTAPAPLSYVETWTYDAMNNPLTYIDGRGNTTTYVYDGNGRLLSETRPGAVTTSYTYNVDGTMASMTDPRGGVSLYTYDAAGNVASSSTPLGNKTTYTYDVAGRVVNLTSPRGNETGATATLFQRKFTYDADGNVLTDTDSWVARRRTCTTMPAAARRRPLPMAASQLSSTTRPTKWFP